MAERPLSQRSSTGMIQRYIHGLGCPIKYARLVRRGVQSERPGGRYEGHRYCVQLIVEGTPHQKKKHTIGTDVVGLDLGPSTIAIVPQEGEAQLLPLCEELKPNARAKRRLERKLDRQRRANNPQNYDDKGRIKKHGKGRRQLVWKNSKGYLATRRRLAHQERKLAAHRKSLHGRLVHEIIRRGNTIVPRSSPTKPGRSSMARVWDVTLQGCQSYVKKPLSQRWHHCACGIGPVQRDLYSAWLAVHLHASDTIPSIAQDSWEGADLRLLGSGAALAQRAKDGQALPRSVGIPRARARLPQSLAPNRLELVNRRGRLEALG